MISGAALVLLLSLAGQSDRVTVSLPDSVRSGDQFLVTITSSDPSCSGLSCSPDYSPGLQYVSSRTMRSFSSSTFNGVTTTQQNCVLQMVFIALEPGSQWIGPFRVTMAGAGNVSMPAETLVVTGGTVQGGSYRGRRAGRRNWMEVEVDSPVLYPGVPFRVAYSLCTTQLVKSIESYWTPPSNGVAIVAESPEAVNWVRRPDGTRRGMFIVLEVTASAPGRLLLPILQADVTTIAQPFSGTGGGGDLTVFSDSMFVTVSDFPDSGRPAGFMGIADSLFFEIEAGEQCRGRDVPVRLTASGPGAAYLEEPPSLTVGGPARLLPVCSRETSCGRYWDMVLSPSDSGMVTIGPDSVAWLDPRSGEYRMAAIRACSVVVESPPEICDASVSPATRSRRRGYLEVFVAAGAALLLGAVILFRWARTRGRAASPEEASDAEELLTAFEAVLSRILTGKSKPLGPDGIADLLEDRGASQILQRRLLRHWKDLEQMMAGHEVRPPELEKARKTCLEIIAEARDLVATRPGLPEGKV